MSFAGFVVYIESLANVLRSSLHVAEELGAQIAWNVRITRLCAKWYDAHHNIESMNG
jgi:hypothetical protein